MIILFNLLIVSRHVVLFLFPSDGGSDITLLELTNQVAHLNNSVNYGLKIKNRFQKIIIGIDPCMAECFS